MLTSSDSAFSAGGDLPGLGATMALMCGIVIAATEAKFGDSQVAVGQGAGDSGALI